MGVLAGCAKQETGAGDTVESKLQEVTQVGVESAPDRTTTRIVENRADQTVTITKRVFVPNSCSRPDFEVTTPSETRVVVEFQSISTADEDEVCAAVVSYVPIAVELDFSELPEGATVGVEGRSAATDSETEYTITGKSTTETI
jgi:hypothetical protein